MQPTMEVVSAELYCVHSRMEYIRTKLRDSESNQAGAETKLGRRRGRTLPHDAGEDKLQRKHRILPAAEGQSLRQTQQSLSTDAADAAARRLMLNKLTICRSPE